MHHFYSVFKSFVSQTAPPSFTRQQAAARATLMGLLVLVGSLLVGDARAAEIPGELGDIKAEKSIYFVLLQDPPLAMYRGGIQDLAATSAEIRGDRYLDREGPAAKAYLAYLETRQARFIARASYQLGRNLIAEDTYTHVLNGFAFSLSRTEASQLEDMPEVGHVEPESMGYLTTDAGPAWSGAEGLWNGSASPTGQPVLGEGMIVGIVDTGINIDHPSFAAIDGLGYEHENPLGEGEYLDFCNPSDNRYDPELKCNSKLIGLWSHPRVGGNPEDENGHGSHTASIAAGNRTPDVELGSSFKVTRSISGVAPHANIVAYDACSGNSCPGQATLAALEQGARDGIHAINYSITVDPGHNNSPWRITHNLAFLALREAGVFAAVAAGNDGPNPQTLTSKAPWVTTIGNSTHDRVIQTQLVEMQGGTSNPPEDLTGSAFTDGFGPATIIYAKGQTLESGQRDDGQCLSPFFGGALRGKIVVCDRGEIPRVDKGKNVLAGGAGGLILVNTAAQGKSTNADQHVLPAVHLDYESGRQLKDWLAAGNGHEGRITRVEFRNDPSLGDTMSASSGRGPSRISRCCARPEMNAIRYIDLMDVIKPDVTAPGTDILAAVATTNEEDPPEYSQLSGTSMASPHVAGASALLAQAHPEWRPAQIQSALMLSARHSNMRKEDKASPAIPFDRGSGHIDISKAAMAGILLNEDAENYEIANPDLGGNPHQLNIASFKSSLCVKNCSWDRHLVSSLDKAQAWRAEFAGPDSLKVEISPMSFLLEPGKSMDLRVTANVDNADDGQWLFGQLKFIPLESEIPALEMPMAVRPARAETPRMIRFETNEVESEAMVAQMRLATDDFDSITLDAFGLVAPERFEHELDTAPRNSNPFEVETGRAVEWIAVGADAKRLVAEINAVETGDYSLWMGFDANDDKRFSANEIRCSSVTSHWAEYCDIHEPAAGNWWVLIQNRTGDDNNDSELFVAIVDDPGPGTLGFRASEIPAEGAALGIELEASWSLPSLEPGDRWYGVLEVGNTEEPAYFSRRSVNLVGADEPGPTPTALVDPPASPSAEPATATPSPSPMATESPSYDLWIPLVAKDH